MIRGKDPVDLDDFRADPLCFQLLSCLDRSVYRYPVTNYGNVVSLPEQRGRRVAAAGSRGPRELIDRGDLHLRQRPRRPIAEVGAKVVPFLAARHQVGV